MERNEEVLFEYLTRINKNCGINIKKYGVAATKSFGIADVALLTWLESLIFNPFRRE